MGHINYNLNYLESSKLFKDIKTKHDADMLLPVGSVIKPFLDEPPVKDLAADLLLVNESDAAHVLFLIKDKLSEDKREQRDNIMGAAFEQHRDMVQFMKRLKRGKVHELGAWGIIISNVDRIDYPSDFLSLRLSMKTFIDKHNSFPVATSPLEPYLVQHPEINLATTLANLGTALTLHNDFVQADKDAEEQRELRDTKFSTPYQHILGIGQFIVGLYPDNPHKAGAWGFTIDEHTQVRKREITLEAGEKMDLKRLDVGSKVFVLSDGEIAITPKTKLTSLKGGRGLSNKKTPYTLTYGYGNATIENLSSDSKVTFTVQFHY